MVITIMASKTTESIDPWIQRYVNKLKNMTGLSNWSITVSPKPSSLGSLAETEIVYGQNLAIMQFHKDFRKDTPEDLRATVVHELLHCHFAPMAEVISDMLAPEDDDPKSKGIHKSVVAVVEYETERIIDGISESIGKWLPTPDIPKRKAKIAKKVAKKVPANRKKK